MKNSTQQFVLMAFFLSLIIWSCAKEKAAVPNGPILSSDYTSLTLHDDFDLPNPASSEKLAYQLFDLKEKDGKLTQSEVFSIGDPAKNEDLVYALLFVEAYDRSEILWSWDEPAEEDGEELDDRSAYGKWRWTGGDPIGSFWCSGFKKWPAQKVKNRFTDPCGEVLEHGAVYQCGYKLCDSDLPIELQPNCSTPMITIPAGSVDALAQAIEDVCPNGTIILAAGEHVENEGVVISKQVTIKGNDGAVLKIHSQLDNSSLDILNIDAALHILDVQKVKIENLNIIPLLTDGGTAILVQNADKCRIVDNDIQAHQMGVVVEQSNKVWIGNNIIHVADGWINGEFDDAHGVVIVNGENATIKENEITGALFGMWLCDKKGISSGNSTFGNYIGQILCNVPPYFELPNGTVTGAEVPCTNWNVNNNVAQNNFDTGYLVIDGANKNHLTNNEGGNNGTYDIELVGDSYRFGFLTPLSYQNTVTTGSFGNLLIKDCGVNNTINGNATIIDTSVAGNECF